ncbi:cation diffusion facilitator family transporter [Pseudoduganella ginsengisoli]|uniref:Cation diffusion facilitator family transporter n=1 Tax=Pseudoduganella ginsengisoli TaxID=1462440 RepID=A0A6L6Q1B7_9BURK|nr:cation diffusion facilitator family transporter [Pseudoduganella ginsengisoli]MTW03141.1 cation diffusion facilitator family transporter [Pseudoduganella ginsengisoli]
MSGTPDSTHLHAHLDGDAHYQHQSGKRSLTTLTLALALTLGFAGVEAISGFLSGSLALVSDAGHMLTDAASLALALFAQHMTRRPPSERYSFGYGRAEALAAFVNGLAMLAVVAWIIIEAAQRLMAPHPVQGAAVMAVALIGLLINVAVAWILSRDQDSMNARAALVHVLGDLLGSVAALAAGAIIYFTGWMQADPLLSVLVALLILKSTFAILRESYHHLMEGVPEQLDYVAVGADIEMINGVASVHDLHVWAMSPGQPALIGHVRICDMAAWPRILEEIRAMLLATHGIDHVTLQPEPA